LKFAARLWLANVLILLGLASSNPAWSEDYRPDLILDLHQLGYRELDDRAVLEYESIENPLIFVDNHTLAVSLIVPNPTPGTSVRGKRFGGRYLFETIFIDSDTGKLLRTQVWSNSSAGSGLFPAPNGAIVVWHDLELDLYAPEGKLLKTLALEPNDFPVHYRLSQSPSGNTLFMHRYDQKARSALRIQTADLKPLGWIDSPQYSRGDWSNANLAFLNPHEGIDPPWDIFIGQIGESKIENIERLFTIPSDPKRLGRIFDNGACEFVSFLDEQTFAVSGQCPHIYVLNTAGEVKYHRSFDKSVTGKVTSSRNSSLLTFSTFVLTGGSVLFDTFPRAKQERVLLFDRNTGGTVEWTPRAILKRPQVDSQGLSPDGCMFAREQDWHLEIYRICGSQIGAKLHLTRAFPQ
jgi:hypothetical protein